MTSVYSDKPSMGKDLLQYNKYASALAELVLTAETPFTIGVSGEWGYGKTTLMNRISFYLDKPKFEEENKNNSIDFEDEIKEFHSDKWKGKNSFFSIFLNTWPFINSKDIGESIFEQIMYELIKVIKGDPEWYKTGGKFLVKTISGLIKTIKLNGKISFGLGEVGGEFNPGDFSLGDDEITYSNFKIELEEILTEIIKHKEGKLLIFIDDLDRLYPKQALEVMLFMKNFLDIEGCIFFIGSDNQVLSDGLEKLYGKDKKDIISIKKSFFEKIYQLEFKLPQIQKKDLQAYLEGFDEIKDLIEDNEENYEEILNYLLKLTPSLNPRKIKRAINIFKLLKNLTGVEDDNNLLLFEIAIVYENNVEDYNIIKEVICSKSSKKIRKEIVVINSVLHTYCVKGDELLIQILNVFGSSDIIKVDYNNILENVIEKFVTSRSFASAGLNLDSLLEYFKNNTGYHVAKENIAEILKGIIENNGHGINQILNSSQVSDIKVKTLLGFLFKEISSDYNELNDLLEEVSKYYCKDYIIEIMGKNKQKFLETIPF